MPNNRLPVSPRATAIGLCRHLARAALPAFLGLYTIAAAGAPAQSAYHAARQHLADGAYGTAALEFSRLAARDPQSPSAFTGRGIAFAAQGLHRLAIVDFSRAIALDVNAYNAYFDRARSRQALGDKRRARLDLLYLLRHLPDDRGARLRLALLQLKNGAITDGIASLWRVVKLFPRRTE